jgi:hypothetical protein
MEPCFVCHTRTGIEKGKFVILEQAMHSSDTFKSCVGCHIKSMKSPDCAGCHAQMHLRQIDEIKCNSCHSVAKESIKPLPIKGDNLVKIAAAEIDMRSAPKPVISDEEIPEKVTIDNMVDQYDSVLFPHRQIVQALAKRTQKSMLAQYFHGETTSLCLGCHHHSPSPMTFPKCASCHAMSLKSEQDAKPGLKGAYHNQCVTCHQQMGIKKPAATNCTACHKKKTATIQPTNRF